MIGSINVPHEHGKAWNAVEELRDIISICVISFTPAEILLDTKNGCINKLRHVEYMKTKFLLSLIYKRTNKLYKYAVWNKYRVWAL